MCKNMGEGSVESLAEVYINYIPYSSFMCQHSYFITEATRLVRQDLPLTTQPP